MERFERSFGHRERPQPVGANVPILPVFLILVRPITAAVGSTIAKPLQGSTAVAQRVFLAAPAWWLALRIHLF